MLHLGDVHHIFFLFSEPSQSAVAVGAVGHAHKFEPDHRSVGQNQTAPVRPCLLEHAPPGVYLDHLYDLQPQGEFTQVDLCHLFPSLAVVPAGRSSRATAHAAGLSQRKPKPK
jgi:hypothetical protein